MVRVGIVDDDHRNLVLLTRYLERFGREQSTQFSITTLSDGAELMHQYRADYDILLLDIEMPGLDGFSAAERIRLVDPDVIIIFITNSPNYAIRGYEVDAQSYVLKPVTYFAFAAQLTKALTRLKAKSGSGEALMLKIAGGLVRVPTDSIVYLESAKHRTVVHTLDGRHNVVGSLKELEQQLEQLSAAKSFFRCNSGYLVNLKHVVSMGADLVTLTGGQELQVSRARKKPFMIALTDYLGAHA